MIECKDIRFSYESGMEVLKGVSFSIAPGESVGLIGANGAGKSTLMRILLGLLALTGGEALIRGTKGEKKSLAEIRETHEALLALYDELGERLREETENL